MTVAVGFITARTAVVMIAARLISAMIRKYVRAMRRFFGSASKSTLEVASALGFLFQWVEVGP